jgi:hypothetical protein
MGAPSWPSRANLMTKRKNPSARVAVIGAVSLVMVGAFIAACGLDDSVVDETAGGPGSGSDATIGADGTTVIPDGATRLPDGEIIFVDAGPDGTPHILLDGADPDDADLSDAALEEGGACATGEYACALGGNTYCLGDCTACVGLNYACERTHTCVDSCSDCADKTECFRSALLGNAQHCVENGASCSLIGGTPVFCGQLPFYFVDCPGSDQVCVSNQCLTCGQLSTTTKTCSPSSDGTCNATDLKCE